MLPDTMTGQTKKVSQGICQNFVFVLYFQDGARTPLENVAAT
jgi:hypothetical protein